MYNLSFIEECYQEFMRNLPRLLPDGMIEVNLSLLHQMNLLNFHEQKDKDIFTRYFHVVETSEKITLINEEFLVWIVPNPTEHGSATHAFIALNKEGKPTLETAFTASGVYNTSSLVLGVLEKFLKEIQETEHIIQDYKEAS